MYPRTSFPRISSIIFLLAASSEHPQGMCVSGTIDTSYVWRYTYHHHDPRPCNWFVPEANRSRSGRSIGEPDSWRWHGGTFAASDPLLMMMMIW